MDLPVNIPPACAMVTPCYSGDLIRFRALVKSVQAFAADRPHFVLLDHEDLPLFKDEFGHIKSIHFVSSRELLPRRIEQLRRFQRSAWNILRTRMAYRFGLDATQFSGWKVQQLLKISFLAQSPTVACIFLDSDILLTRPLTDTDIWSDQNSLFLLQTPAVNGEDISFELSTHILFKNSLALQNKFYNYIHQAPRFFKRTGKVLLDNLQSKHTDWHNVFIQQKMPSEYSLLGYSARELEHFDGYQIAEGKPDNWAYRIAHPSEISQLTPLIELCISEKGQRGFFLIQSNLNLPPQLLHPAVDRIFSGLMPKK